MTRTPSSTYLRRCRSLDRAERCIVAATFLPLIVFALLASTAFLRIPVPIDLALIIIQVCAVVFVALFVLLLVFQVVRLIVEAW